MSDSQHIVIQIAKQARQAARQLALATEDEKNQALQQIAAAIRQQQTEILAANQQDVAQAQQAQRSAAIVDRLTLTPERIEAMAAGVEAIAALPDPVGKLLAQFERPNGLVIRRVSVPLGVIGVIYEARPNVTADAAALCLKSGNAVILRGGSECFHSAQAIMNAMASALAQSSLPATAVQMIPTQDRDAVGTMLQCDEYIDVIVPRGGLSLIQRISDESKIPLFKHLQGICHTYVHTDADIEMALNVVVNAKLRRTGICGATETLLVDHAIVHSHGLPIIQALLAEGCEIRGDETLQALDENIKAATAEDWDTEYLDNIISVKSVANITEAIDHINTHGSHHTDAIITDDKVIAKQFLQSIDSAIVMHNASTQFADGGEFGMGAEIGIATGKLHARGPVGVEQLTTFNYQVSGSGQTRPKA